MDAVGSVFVANVTTMELIHSIRAPDTMIGPAILVAQHSFSLPARLWGAAWEEEQGEIEDRGRHGTQVGIVGGGDGEHHHDEPSMLTMSLLSSPPKEASWIGQSVVSQECKEEGCWDMLVVSYTCHDVCVWSSTTGAILARQVVKATEEDAITSVDCYREKRGQGSDERRLHVCCCTQQGLMVVWVIILGGGESVINFDRSLMGDSIVEGSLEVGEDMRPLMCCLRELNGGGGERGEEEEEGQRERESGYKGVRFCPRENCVVAWGHDALWVWRRRVKMEIQLVSPAGIRNQKRVDEEAENDDYNDYNGGEEDGDDGTAANRGLTRSGFSLEELLDFCVDYELIETFKMGEGEMFRSVLWVGILPRFDDGGEERVIRIVLEGGWVIDKPLVM